MDPNICLQRIVEHLFHRGGSYAECLELIEALAECLAKGGFKPEGNTHADWEAILVGSYWFTVDWHGGQWSDEYRLQCVVGRTYSPGCNANGTEPGSAESDVYSALDSLYRESHPEACEALNG